MFTGDILISLMNVMSFSEVLNFGQVNRKTFRVSNSVSYWRHRFLTKVGKSSVSYIEISGQHPKTNYSWSIANSSLFLIDPEAVIYLSENHDIIFSGLEQVIGIEEFMTRCVRLNVNIHLLEYATTKDPSVHIVNRVKSFAIELDRRSHAKYLSQITDSVEYDVRYGITLIGDRVLDRIDITDVVSLIERYRTKYQETPSGPDGEVLARYIIVNYLIGLIERVKFLKTCLAEEMKESKHEIREAESNFIRECPKCGGHTTPLVDKFVGMYGTKKMLDAYLKGLPPSSRWAPEKKIAKIIKGAWSNDNVELVEHLVRINICKDMSLPILSVKMHDLLIEHVPIENVIKGVIQGGNYRLLFKYVNTFGIDHMRRMNEGKPKTEFPLVNEIMEGKVAKIS